MLKPFDDLPLTEHGVTTVASYRRHRCDMLAAGQLDLKPGTPYRFDNARRADEDACVLQLTVAGVGRWRGPGGEEEALGPGEGFLTALPSNSAYWLPADTAWRFAYLYFTGELARYHVDAIVRARGHRFSIGDHHPLALAIANQLRAVFELRGDECSLSAGLYAVLMAAHPRPDAVSEPDGIAKARAVVAARYGDGQLGVADLAAAAGMSRYHFSRLFKQACGSTPYAYLVDTRIRKALELLAGGDKPAKAIAAEVGFNDYPHFCNAFKQHVGTTPKRYRDRVRGGISHRVV